MGWRVRGLSDNTQQSEDYEVIIAYLISQLLCFRDIETNPGPNVSTETLKNESDLHQILREMFKSQQQHLKRILI